MVRRQTLIESLMRQRHWSQEQVLAELERTARTMGVRSYTLSRRQLARWLSGEVITPRGTACQVAERLFGYPIESLLRPVELEKPVSSQTAGHGKPVLDLAEIVTTAASDSRGHATLIAVGSVDDASLEQLHAEIRRLAHAYAHMPPVALHVELIRTRDLAYRLLELTRRPDQLKDLYRVAGEACGLLASTTFDLGYADAAEDHARAAYTYGQVTGNDRLRAWARSVQATIAFWAGRPQESLDYAGSALCYAADLQAARLHAITARAWSMVGARDQVNVSLRNALAAMDTAGDELTQIGGEFVFGPARMSLCAAAVHVTLGDGRSAAKYAHEALQLYEVAPADQRRFAMYFGAWIDLATARAMQGHLDGAEAALQGALALDPARRTARLIHRLGKLCAVVGREPLRRAAPARRIAQVAADFMADAPVVTRRELPLGS